MKNDLTSGLNIAPILPNINNDSNSISVVKITVEHTPDADDTSMFYDMQSVARQT